MGCFKVKNSKILLTFVVIGLDAGTQAQNAQRTLLIGSSRTTNNNSNPGCVHVL
jgi:hypothetical protein